MNYELVKLNTARNCLRYIIKAFNIKEIYVPYYLCPAIRTAITKEECKIKYYHIDLNFKLVDELPKEAYILYPNYFGICSNIVDKLAKKYPNLIVDNAHSFFSKPCGIASFNSLRKFFSQIKDGAFLYTTITLETKFEKDLNSYNLTKMTFEEICKNENRLDTEDIKLISDCSLNYYKELDLEWEKNKLLTRFRELASELKNNRLKIDFKKGDVPFKYPFLAENEDKADEIVEKYSDKDNFIFRYWNNLPDSFIEKDFYKMLVVI